MVHATTFLFHGQIFGLITESREPNFIGQYTYKSCDFRFNGTNSFITKNLQEFTSIT